MSLPPLPSNNAFVVVTKQTLRALKAESLRRYGSELTALPWKDACQLLLQTDNYYSCGGVHGAHHVNERSYLANLLEHAAIVGLVEVRLLESSRPNIIDIALGGTPPDAKKLKRICIFHLTPLLPQCKAHNGVGFTL